MKIVTDATANLTDDQVRSLDVIVVPFQILFRGNAYWDGKNITPAEFYRLLLECPEDFPETATPSVGDFTGAYQQTVEGEEVLSIHVSSGLSGAYNAALVAADAIAPRNRVTVVDSRMVSTGEGWQVEIAARAARLGWSVEKILVAIKHIKSQTETMFTVSDMRYLIHGGRISHLKGLVASMLRIKPIVGMNDADGRYEQRGQEMLMNKAFRKMAQSVKDRFGPQKLRVQFMHGNNLPGAEALRDAFRSMLDFIEDPLICLTPAIGAHAGPTVVAFAAAPLAAFDIVK
jgi:DegV family protein with EDD domain